MGLGTRESVVGCVWGVSSDEEEVVVFTLEDRVFRKKTLVVECDPVLKDGSGMGEIWIGLLV